MDAFFLPRGGFEMPVLGDLGQFGPVAGLSYEPGPALVLNEDADVLEVIGGGLAPLDATLLALRHQVARVPGFPGLYDSALQRIAGNDLYPLVMLLEYIERADFSDAHRASLEVLMGHVVTLLFLKAENGVPLEPEDLNYFNRIRLFRLLLLCPYVSVEDRARLVDAVLASLEIEKNHANRLSWLDAINDATGQAALSDEDVRRVLVFVFNQLTLESLPGQEVERYVQIFGNALACYALSYGVQEAALERLVILSERGRTVAIVSEVIHALGSALRGEHLHLGLREQALKQLFSFKDSALFRRFTWFQQPLLLRRLLIELGELAVSGLLAELEWHDAVNIIYACSQSGYAHCDHISYGVITAWTRILQTEGIDPFLRQGFLSKLIEFLKAKEERPAYIIEEGVAGLRRIAHSPDASNAELTMIVDALELILHRLPRFDGLVLKHMVLALASMLTGDALNAELRIRVITILNDLVTVHAADIFVRKAFDDVREDLALCTKNFKEMQGLGPVFRALPKHEDAL